MLVLVLCSVVGLSTSLACADEVVVYTSLDQVFSKPVGMVFPDKEGLGTLLIPSTVALVRDGPNPEQARRLSEVRSLVAQ